MTTQDKHPSAAEEIQFTLQRVYVKDSSFEAPGVPAIFQQQWEPDLTLDINTTHRALEQDVYEVVLTVTATVKNRQAIAFLVEVKQAGIFTIKGTEQKQLNHLIGSFCPNILFPYAREAITSHVIRGSFPQLVLAPINFDALYMQQLEKQKEAQAQTTQ